MKQVVGPQQAGLPTRPGLSCTAASPNNPRKATRPPPPAVTWIARVVRNIEGLEKRASDRYIKVDVANT